MVTMRAETNSQAATGSQLGGGIRGKHHPGLNSKHFSLIVPVMSFRLPEIQSPGNRRVRGVNSTPTAHHIFSCTLVARTCFYLLSECTVTH